MNNDVNNNPFNFKPNTPTNQANDSANAGAPVSEPVSTPAENPATQVPEPPKPEQPAPEPSTVQAPAAPSIPEVPVSPEPAPVVEPSPVDAPNANPMQESAQVMPETPVAAPSDAPSSKATPEPAPQAEPAPAVKPDPAPEPNTVAAPAGPIVNKIAESEGKLDQPQQTTQNNIPNPSSPEVMFRNEKQQMEIEAQRQEQQDQNPKPDFNKNELTRLFVGKNYDKVMTNRINFSALFLSPPYFFYRKMAIYGLGTILVQILTNIILLAFLPKIVTYTIQLGVCILWGVLFNKLYIRYVNSSVDEIMKKSNSMDEAKKLCISDGGTNAGYVLLSMAVSVILSAAIFALFPALMVAVLGNTLTP